MRRVCLLASPSRSRRAASQYGAGARRLSFMLSRDILHPLEQISIVESISVELNIIPSLLLRCSAGLFNTRDPMYTGKMARHPIGPAILLVFHMVTAE